MTKSKLMLLLLLALALGALMGAIDRSQKAEAASFCTPAAPPIAIEGLSRQGDLPSGPSDSEMTTVIDPRQDRDVEGFQPLEDDSLPAPDDGVAIPEWVDDLLQTRGRAGCSDIQATWFTGSCHGAPRNC